MRRHINDRGELFAVTLTRSEWNAYEEGFRSAAGEEPSILTWCPKQGAIFARAIIVPFGDPSAAPEEFLAAAGTTSTRRSATAVATKPAVTVFKEPTRVDTTT